MEAKAFVVLEEFDWSLEQKLMLVLEDPDLTHLSLMLYLQDIFQDPKYVVKLFHVTSVWVIQSHLARPEDTI